MSNGVAIPPAAGEPRKGCLGKACLSFVALAVLFAVALVGGGWWALLHFRDTYSATEPLALPTPPAIEPSAEPTPNVPPPEPVAPTAMPAPPSRRVTDGRPLEARWKAFEKAGKRGQPAQIELTAAEINALVNNSAKLRGMAYVAVENNEARLQFSVPLDRILMMEGRYLNGAATLVASPDGDPRKIRVSNIVVGNQAVADSVMDQGWFGGASVRYWMNRWLDEQSVTRLEVRDNVVIGETAGGQ